MEVWMALNTFLLSKGENRTLDECTSFPPWTGRMSRSDRWGDATKWELDLEIFGEG